MSRRRRYRTSSPSLPPLSQTCKKAEPIAPPNDFIVRYAETDEDAIAIHRFLCVVAEPVLFTPIDAQKSMTEVYQVVKNSDYGFALMAITGGIMVGTMGVICPEWWYGDGRFFTDRWFFVTDQFKNKGISQALVREAETVARETGIDLIINGKMRRKGAGSKVINTLPRTTFAVS